MSPRNLTQEVATKRQRSQFFRLGQRVLTGCREWWRGVTDWFLFVHKRRVDRRFSVFNNIPGILEAVAIFLVCLLLLIFFVDPPYLQSVQTAAWTPSGFFETITTFGKSDWILYPTGIALILYSLFRPGGMVSRSHQFGHTALLAVYYIFTTIAFSGLLANLIKLAIGRARPEEVVGAGVWESAPFRGGYEFASFPSGHATTAGALSVALALLFPRLRIYFLLAGVWIALSRPLVGVHFPSDVLAGFCVGGAFSYYYARSFARKRLLFGFSESGRVLPRFSLVRLGRLGRK